MVGRLGMGQPYHLISPTGFSVLELAYPERRLPQAGQESFPSFVVIKSSQVTRQAPLVSLQPLMQEVETKGGPYS